jgi:NADH:ubiquinone oxidoreductase subunit E
MHGLHAVAICMPVSEMHVYHFLSVYTYIFAKRSSRIELLFCANTEMLMYMQLQIK